MLFSLWFGFLLVAARVVCLLFVLQVCGFGYCDRFRVEDVWCCWYYGCGIMALHTVSLLAGVFGCLFNYYTY